MTEFDFSRFLPWPANCPWNRSWLPAALLSDTRPVKPQIYGFSSRTLYVGAPPPHALITSSSNHQPQLMDKAPKYGLGDRSWPESRYLSATGSAGRGFICTASAEARKCDISRIAAFSVRVNKMKVTGTLCRKRALTRNWFSEKKENGGEKMPGSHADLRSKKQKD